MAGVVIGAVIVWIASRAGRQIAIDTAILRVQAESQSELSQLRERARATEETRKEAIESYADLMAKHETLVKDLEKAREDAYRLEERANRVEGLDAALAKSAEDFKVQGDELRRISAEASGNAALALSHANRAQDMENRFNEINLKVTSYTEQVNSLTALNATLEQQVAGIPALRSELAQIAQSLSNSEANLVRVKERCAALEEQVTRIPALEHDLNANKQALSDSEGLANQLSVQVSRLTAQLEGEIKASQEKLDLLETAKNTLSEQFKNVANDLLEEKSKKFAEQNQTNLSQILDPLRLQINEFKGKVEDVYVQESKDRSAMAEQVRQLVSLNQALSQDAKNLTSALKGNVKAQGNWGELVLERVLEASGLRKGEEYLVQDSQIREDGTRAQPDVVILLPEQRKLVVDSKVSLNAYEEYAVSDSEEVRLQAARKHLDSVRRHVQGLSTKSYEKLYGNGLDFVLMFVPIEPAFMLAISNDDNLFMDAWERNVLLVSPSTLLFVVRTVAHLWRQEQQSQNAQEIAKRGAELYDKLSDFVKDLDQLGTRLKQAQEYYDGAYKRLATGRGNVIRQAEMLRELGVKATKKLPALAIEMSGGEPDGGSDLDTLSGKQSDTDPVSVPESDT